MVNVVDYDPSWPGVFAGLAARIWPGVQGLALAIEHVGSTSVPGLAAKPVIDMDLVVRRPDMAALIGKLAFLGYSHQGNLGIEDREAFRSPPGLPDHHLYACVEGSLGLRNHLVLRDLLRKDGRLRDQYGALKKALAREHAGSVDDYTMAKTGFVVAALRGAGLEEGSLRRISQANL